MTSAGDDGCIVSVLPQMILPKVKVDPETNSQTTPMTPNESVDTALLELVHSVQHEIRTPLHGMLSHIEFLFADMKEEIARSGHQQRVNDILVLGKQLSSVLDDFRDYASHTVEARDAEENHRIQPSDEADLGKILDEIASDVWDNQVKSMQAEKGPDARIPPPPELILTLDSSLASKKSLVCVESFKTVAKKLIDNAMKFTPSGNDGYVEISLAPHRTKDAEEEEKDEKTQSYLRLSVEDTGTGMTNEFVSDQLFTAFAKADKFKVGCGLSMALCSSLVRKMGGSMQVSSDKDRGTTVIVLLPVTNLGDDENEYTEKLKGLNMRAPSSPQLVYFHRFDGRGLKRLAGSISSQLATYGNVYTTTHIEEADHIFLPEEVCYGDDNDELDELLTRAKRGVKIGVMQAHKDAKINLAAKKNGSPPPVFVTRKPFGPQSFLRLVQAAVSSDSSSDGSSDSRRMSDFDQEDVDDMSEGESEELRNLRAKGRLNSSTDLVTTTDMSVEVLRGIPPSVRMLKPLLDESVDGLGARPPRTFTVLCVEDNALNMRILTRLVSQCKVEYTMASDGEEAVEQFKQRKPALVLLDITMPKKDGYEACKEMRALEEEGGHRAHIIAITALGDDYSRRRGLEECGMDEWLTKPLDIIKFKKDVIKLKEAFNGK